MEKHSLLISGATALPNNRLRGNKEGSDQI